MMTPDEQAALFLLLVFVGACLHEVAHWLVARSLGAAATIDVRTWGVYYEETLGRWGEAYVATSPYLVGLALLGWCWVAGVAVWSYGLVAGLLIPSREDLSIVSRTVLED